MSSFKGQDLFGSGPHRFRYRGAGQQLLDLFRIDSLEYGSAAIGDGELEGVVTGRLVAATESALRALRAAVESAGSFAAGPGTLVDNVGRSVAGARLISYEETGPVDRGRVWSVAYEAVFRVTREDALL